MEYRTERRLSLILVCHVKTEKSSVFPVDKRNIEIKLRRDQVSIPKATFAGEYYALKILLSPSKRQESQAGFRPHKTQAVFLDEAVRIHRIMEAWSENTRARRLSISADLNAKVGEYIGSWSPEKHQSGTAAYLLYRGDVFDGLKADDLSGAARHRAELELVIFSALYGVLMGGDATLPHRLDLKDPVKVGGKGLTAFWQPRVKKIFDAWREEWIIDLSSSEYAALLPRDFAKYPKAYRIDFKEWRSGKLQTVSVFAKKARGAFARELLENPISSQSDLLKMEVDGFRYSAGHSNEKLLLYVR